MRKALLVFVILYFCHLQFANGEPHSVSESEDQAINSKEIATKSVAPVSSPFLKVHSWLVTILVL